MNVVGLVSSGIDSPVAAYLVSRYAESIILVHADNRPFTDDREIDKFIILAKHLKKICSIPVKAVVVPHGETLQMYRTKGLERFTCVFCKRMMLRYAERIATQEHAEGIVMGDSLGQVASQTLQNIHVVEQAIAIPVLRPLIGFDKEEVVQIAKKIGTFDLSIAKSAGCGAVPVTPSTRASLEQVLAEEQKVDVEGLVSQAVSGVRVVTL
jgi:thiamine biosynthesis protein ThiI